jgi:predicted O-methyltransferase YrrM
VVYSLRDEDRYPDLSEFSDGTFDFMLIDGIRRTDCVRNVISKVKSVGWIYLDNTDMSTKSKPGNDFQQAEQLLL